MAWKPGESGNPEGRAASRPFLAALERAIKQNDGKALRAAADKVLAMAEAGEPWAIQFLADRTDGKARQQLEVSGEGGGPLQIEHKSS